MSLFYEDYFWNAIHLQIFRWTHPLQQDFDFCWMYKTGLIAQDSSNASCPVDFDIKASYENFNAFDLPPVQGTRAGMR